MVCLNSRDIVTLKDLLEAGVEVTGLRVQLSDEEAEFLSDLFNEDKDSVSVVTVLDLGGWGFGIVFDSHNKRRHSLGELVADGHGWYYDIEDIEDSIVEIDGFRIGDKIKPTELISGIVIGFRNSEELIIEIDEVGNNGLKLGNTVKLKNNEFEGRYGTIVAIENPTSVTLFGVELDEFHERGHDLGGKTEYGYGYWVVEENLIAVGESEGLDDDEYCTSVEDCVTCEYKYNCGMEEEVEKMEEKDAGCFLGEIESLKGLLDNYLLEEETEMEKDSPLFEVGDIVSNIGLDFIKENIYCIVEGVEEGKTGRSKYRYKTRVIDSQGLTKERMDIISKLSWDENNLIYVSPSYNMSIIERDDGNTIVCITDFPKITCLLNVEGKTFVGESKCNLSVDEFDPVKGTKIAMTRLNIMLAVETLEELVK